MGAVLGHSSQDEELRYVVLHFCPVVAEGSMGDTQFIGVFP